MEQVSRRKRRLEEPPLATLATFLVVSSLSGAGLSVAVTTLVIVVTAVVVALACSSSS